MKAITFFVLMGSWFFRGYVVMSLWNWFPHMMFSVPSINYAGALGLSMLSTLLAKKASSDNMTDEQELAQSIGIVLMLFMALGIGFIVSKFL